MTNQLRDKTEALEIANAEIRRLKNLPKKPDIKPSKLDTALPEDKSKDSEEKEERVRKRKKVGELRNPSNDTSSGNRDTSRLEVCRL